RNNDRRVYATTGAKLLGRKRRFMGRCSFACRDYRSITGLGPGHVVYADPPYLGTARYSMGFDQEDFYAWCEARAREGAAVLVSEFTNPGRPGWEVVWSMERKVAVNCQRPGRPKRVELLLEVKA
ncbi:MAG: hypothetical protein L0Y64_24260, partial [Myxococcaceae bacterium]|nr:hypothetical protein [Myxococcaceae bacterium]